MLFNVNTRMVLSITGNFVTGTHILKKDVFEHVQAHKPLFFPVYLSYLNISQGLFSLFTIHSVHTANSGVDSRAGCDTVIPTEN